MLILWLCFWACCFLEIIRFRNTYFTNAPSTAICTTGVPTITKLLVFCANFIAPPCAVDHMHMYKLIYTPHGHGKEIQPGLQIECTITCKMANNPIEMVFTFVYPWSYESNPETLSLHYICQWSGWWDMWDHPSIAWGSCFTRCTLFTKLIFTMTILCKHFTFCVYNNK